VQPNFVNALSSRALAGNGWQSLHFLTKQINLYEKAVIATGIPKTSLRGYTLH
jgi:hypothetical protein